MTGRARGRARGRGRAQEQPAAPGAAPAAAPARAPSAPSAGRGRSRGAPPPQNAQPQAAAARGPPAAQVQEVTQAVGQMAVKDQRPPRTADARRRPGLGEERSDGLNFKEEGKVVKGAYGGQINIVSNFFKMVKLPQFTGLFQYNVQFEPAIESGRLKSALLHELDDTIGKTRCFDGMTMFLPKKLPEREQSFQVKTLKGEAVTIKILFTNDIPENSPSIVQLMNIMFRRQLKALKMQLIGRNYFDPERKIEIDSHKMQVWPGISTSILQYDKDVMLCADVSHKVLRQQSVLEFLYEMHKSTPQNRFYDVATKKLVGEIVLTRYNNKTYRIDDIDWNTHPSDSFTMQDGSSVTYTEYLKRAYNLTVRDEQQPMLVSKLKAKDQKRGMTGALHLLPEFCSITGLSEELRANFQIMKELAVHTRVSPEARAKSLQAFMSSLHSNAEAQHELGQWNMSFDKQLLRMQGRVFPPEAMQQATAKFSYKAAEADWSRDTRGQRLIAAVNIDKWLLLSTQRDQNVAADFTQTLQKVCGPMGMNVKPPTMLKLSSDDARTFSNTLKDNLSAGDGNQIVVCIVPNNRKDRYDAIKKICCVERPIPSQVVVSRTLSKKQMLMSVCTKIGIQLNCKLGGEVWAVEIPLKKLMVIGIDVYHDSLTKGKSIGGFVATMNHTLTRYYSTITQQQTRMELFDQLKVCMTAALRKFNEINGALPERIIIYRDGVGDGMLRDVKDYELPQINSAIQEISGGYAPKMAFVVVKKRISTRLFAASGSGLSNPPPGTVVDDTVTRPEWYDFFLVSQSVRQGTVSPTHYNVVLDTSGLKPDHIQRLTYKLCHLYYNWPGTIRVPAPCQYAHKLAFLVGQSIHVEPAAVLQDRLYYL